LCTVAAARNHVAKSFPNTSSESDLQHYRSVWDRSSRERKSPSLSYVASDSLRHKVGNRVTARSHTRRTAGKCGY
jgi:hypothetical protein